MGKSSDTLAEQVLAELIELRSFIEVKIDALDSRITNVEARLTTLQGQVAGLTSEIVELRRALS